MMVAILFGSLTVQLIQHQDVYGFNQQVRDFLLRHEALHQSMLSQCYALTQWNRVTSATFAATAWLFVYGQCST